MSAGVLVAAMLAAASPDPCARPPPGAPRDSVAAEAYRAVGDGEREAGRRDSATIAYREAVSLDPGNGEARAGLEGLCREQRQLGAFDRGLLLLRQDDCRAAASALAPAREAGDRAAALLEGICLYRLGEDRRAEEVLRQAEADAELRDPARLFLGLAALHQGRAREAVSLLEASAGDRSLAPLAGDLARAARRQGKVVLSLVGEAGWDSNVELAPGGAPAASRVADGVASVSAALSFAPMGESGPFASAAATWREQFRADAYDMRAAGVGVGWQVGQGRRHALLAYDHDDRSLGGVPYLSAHRLLLGGRIPLGPAWSAGVTYSARLEDFRPLASRDYSGLHQAAEVDLEVRLGSHWAATAAWRGGHDQARVAWLSWWEHGPRLSVRKVLGSTVRTGLELAWTWRAYDAADPVLQAVRRDGYADASALLEVDLGAHWTLRAAVTSRRALSSVPDFRYTSLVPTIGFAGTLGLL